MPWSAYIESSCRHGPGGLDGAMLEGLMLADWPLPDATSIVRTWLHDLSTRSRGARCEELP
jgi:hypothetical protein